MAQLLKKEVATLEKDVDNAKANEIVAKDFVKAGLAADAFKDGNVATVVGYADSVQKLVKNVTDNNKDATTGIAPVKLGGKLGEIAANLVREYASDKFSAVTGGVIATSKGGSIITFVDAKDPGLWETLKNSLNNVVYNAKAIKLDKVDAYPAKDLKLSKQEALKLIAGLEVIAKRFDTVFKENGGLMNLLFGGNALKVIGSASSGNAGAKGTLNNIYRANMIGIKAGTVANSVAMGYADYVKRYVAAVIKASK